MRGKRPWLLFAVPLSLTLTLSLALLGATPSGAAKKGAAGGKVDPGTCFDCHDEVKALRAGGKHLSLACETCHSGLAEHVKEEGKVKPVTTIDAALCGKCHREQYASFVKTSLEAPARKEKGVPAGRSPMQDKLLYPYGFTTEHNEPRGHQFMVIDQFIVDRFYGGRFQLKEPVEGVARAGNTWDLVYDTGKELAETKKAGNPTCIQCKTSDHLLNWKYMGDKDPKARFDRTSKVEEVAKATNHVLGCVHCHDPHGAKPRVVRDALVEAVSVDGSKAFERGGKTDLEIVSFRDGFRKIGVMRKADARIMCAQCHVEYACGSGFRFSDGSPVGYEDRRTNHFPLTGPMALLEHYRKLDFFDFRHEVTGARLVKLQHPEAETYLGSVHDRAGVTCADCHMGKVKGKGGKSYTNHEVLRPKNHVKASCLPCHKDYSAEEKLYQVEAVQNYTRGRMRKAEYWLGRLIDTYAAARRAGVDEAVLAEARARHEEAHVLWEWWTAENSDGFHNPVLARESLTASIAASKKGVDALNKALYPQK
jgi:formate-dependent nitrite reductase cytochrome c552 subunit